MAKKRKQRKYDLSGMHEGKNPCLKCSSSDGFHYYGEGLGGYCWACQWSVLSDEKRKELDGESNEDDYEELEEVSTREKITDEENKRLKEYTTFDGKGYRGIRNNISTGFGVRYEYSQETGELVAQYVPTTVNGGLVGYRRRKMPKDFTSPIGVVGKECDMIFQFKFKTHKKCVMITGGEIKALAAFQMLTDNKTRRGYADYEDVAVVCSTLGETGAFKQVKAQYMFFDQFDKIVVCMDNDKAGREAAEKIMEVLPKGKGYLMSMQLKDADEYIAKGKETEFIREFYAAKKHVPEGITASTGVAQKMREHLSIPRITLPPFMHKLQKKLRGGLPQACILNLISASGTGKSTWVDAMTLHWIMSCNVGVGIIPLETSEGEYGVNLLSSYAGVKINLFETVEDRLEFLDRPDIEDLQQKLFMKEDGTPRFYILDANAETLKQRVEYMIKSLDCKIIIIDPLQDVFDMLGDEEQAKFMVWMKEWMKTGILFVNVNHVRKSGQGQKANSKGADLSEEDIHGASQIFKSGGINLIFMRNKEAEDVIERNTTTVKMTKARGVGDTGIVGKYYYDLETHNIWDLDDYLDHLERQPRANGLAKVSLYEDAPDAIPIDTGEPTKPVDTSVREVVDMETGEIIKLPVEDIQDPVVESLHSDTAFADDCPI